MFTALKVIVRRLRAFFRTGDLDRDFEQELDSHVAMLEDDNVRRGMTPAQARREALIRVGGVTSIRLHAPGAASLIIRSALPPRAIMDTVRREVQAIDRDQPVFTMQTLEQMSAADRWPYRIFGSLFAILAGIALVLSSVGLYAVMANSVTERTQEIGVRMAVGAQPWDVSWLVLERGPVQLAIGLPLGLAGALALGVVLQRMLVVAPGDPLTFAGITILLTVVSLAACLLPARRATRVDPVVALRAE